MTREERNQIAKIRQNAVVELLRRGLRVSEIVRLEDQHINADCSMISTYRLLGSHRKGGCGRIEIDWEVTGTLQQALQAVRQAFGRWVGYGHRATVWRAAKGTGVTPTRKGGWPTLDGVNLATTRLIDGNLSWRKGLRREARCVSSKTKLREARIGVNEQWVR